MKTCGRCHERIKDGEGYDTFIPHSASGVAPAEYIHKRSCRPILRQVAPGGRTNRC